MTRHRTDCRFLTLHALRIRGFATASLIADMCALSETDVSAELDALASDELAVYRAPRSRWQITPAGRAAPLELLDNERAAVDLTALRSTYGSFLALNDDFKTICADWQLRGGEINDHTDRAYDEQVVQRLLELDDRAQPLVTGFADVLARFRPYAPRLRRSRTHVEEGDVRMIAGVMCGSYHDVWMELHEDLLITQGISRAAEGST